MTLILPTEAPLLEKDIQQIDFRSAWSSREAGRLPALKSTRKR